MPDGELVPFTALIKTDDRIQLLGQRMQGLAQEGYQHELNWRTAQARGDETAMAQCQVLIDGIRQALGIHEEELAEAAEDAAREAAGLPRQPQDHLPNRATRRAASKRAPAKPKV